MDMLENSYMAHGYCLLWKPWLVALHGVSDVLIAMSYWAIPFAIFIFLRRRPNLEMKNLAWLFVGFITLCGMTHIVGLITLWTPIYETEGWIKVITAILSVTTAIAIFPLIPKALAIPSPTELQTVNGQLTDEIAAHKRTLAELEAARDQLAERFEQRTSELAENQAFLKRITDIAPTLLYVHDLRTDSNVWMNHRVVMTLGYSVEELSGMGGDVLQALMHPDDFDRYETHNQKLLHLGAEEIAEFEYRMKARDGEWRWILSQDMVYQGDGAGGVAQIIGAAHDITERREQEERIRLLMREVNHRAKNLLTVVQSVARQTARTASPEHFAEDLSNRLRALSMSQDLIIEGNWQGVSLDDLTRSQLRHLAGEIGERVLISGTRITLSPAAAQGIGMALHELATNAMKHGALSVETGKVLIDWQIENGLDGPVFRIEWREQDGPPVSEPSSEGFGRTVIERMAAHAVDGDVSLDYLPDGVRWRLSAPLERVQNRFNTLT